MKTDARIFHFFCNFEQEDWERRQQSRLNAAIEKGLKLGQEKGFDNGMEKGIEKGFQKGILKVAKKMKDAGASFETIAEFTGLDFETINKIS